MTILGKILVIVNFVFSLVAAGLMIAVHSASTNWHSAYDKAVKELQVAKTNADLYISEIDKVRTEEAAKSQAAETKAKAAETELAKTRQERDDLRNKEKEAVEQRNIIDANRENMTAELKRAKDEIAQFNKLMSDRDKLALKLEGEKKELRDRAVNAELFAKAEHDRNEQLLAHNEQLTREIQTQKAGGTRTADRNPPPETVDGVVTKIDSRTGLVTLSVGSDAGLAAGHTLEVYRLKPEARYVGVLRIVDVRSNEAVARPVPSQMSRSVQVGDTVASSISAAKQP